jgi:tetratricopeptide (TPR) repeat protein
MSVPEITVPPPAAAPVSPDTPDYPPSPPASPVMSVETPTIGMDIGSVTTRIAVLNPLKPMPTIIRNALGNEATSTVVSFAANEARSFGENAAARQVTKASETVVDLAPWIFGYTAGEESMTDRPASLEVVSPTLAMSEAIKLASRQLGSQPHPMHPAQVAAYYIKCLLSFLPDKGMVHSSPLCLAVPSAATAASFEALRQAALLAGAPQELTLIAPSDEASAVYFHHMQYANLPQTREASVPVVLIDIGQSCSTASLILASQPCVEKITCQTLRVGSEYIDTLLVSHVYTELDKKFGAAAAPLRGDIKSFRKILRECRKAKEVLSTADETRVQLEGLRGDIDIVVPITRALLEKAASPLLRSIRIMLASVKDKIPPTNGAGEAVVPRVEVIGGGWRTVCVMEVMKEVFEIDRVGLSLDANLAVAEGSAILAEIYRLYATKDNAEKRAAEEAAAPVAAAHRVDLVGFEVLNAQSPIRIPLSADAVSAVSDWNSAEQQMEANDDRIHERLAALNQLDSYVLQTVNDVDSCTATPEKKAELRSYLEEVDVYVRNEGDTSSTEELKEKLAHVQAHVKEHFPELDQYYETVRAEEKRKEEELTKLSKERQEDESELKSDPQRLRMAQKRKEQGQGLFKDGCWAEAQTRFVQALAILGQLYDTTSEENKTKKHEISLSCYLNIASCSVKLGLWRNAVNNCTHALELVPDHPKALFRRGQAYNAMKDFKEAVADLERARELSNDDPAVVAELAKAKAALEAQKAKEKKMFSKMFA